MPAPTYTNDQVAHFRHCVRIESALQSYKTLHVSFYPSEYDNMGVLDAMSFDEQATMTPDYDSSIFWLYPGLEGDPEGVSYLATSISISGQNSATDMCYNVFRNSNSQAAVLPRQNNSFTLSEQWYIVWQGGDLFSIHSATDNMCLTANENDNIVNFSEYAGQRGQWWRLMTQYSPEGGVFNIAPGLDTSQSIQSLTSSNGAFATIGASSQKAAHPAMVLELVNQLRSPTSLVGDIMSDISFPTNREETRWDRAEVLDDDTHRIIFEQGGRKTPKMLVLRNGSWLPQGNALVTTSGLGGRFTAQRYKYNTSSVNWLLSSFDGENRLGEFPTAQPYGSDSTDPTRAWFMLPANLYDDTLPTPFDMRLVLNDGGTTQVELSASQALPVADSTSFNIKPKFVCEHSQYVVVAKLKYRVDGVWGDWSQVFEPGSGNVQTCSEAPFAKLGGGPAWIPNAFRADDITGEGISQPISFGPLFGYSGGADADAAMLSVSITPIRYGEWTGYPQLPYEGRTITQDVILGRHITASISSASVDQNGIHLTLSTSGVSGPWTAHIESITLPGTSFGETLEYLDHPVDIQVSSGQSQITIPFTELCRIDATLLASSSASLQVRMSVRTDIANVGMTLSGSITSSLRRYYYSSLIYNIWGGYVENFYTPSLSYYAEKGFQRLHSERGDRFVPAPYVSRGGGIQLVNHSGEFIRTSDGTAQSPLGVVFLKDGNNSWYFCIQMAIQDSHKVAAIFRNREQITEIIPLQGNFSGSFSAQNDATVLRRLHGRRSIVGSMGGQASSVQFTGTIFRDQLADIPAPPSGFEYRTDIQALYEISPDEKLIMRTPYGTEYLVSLIGIDSPRDSADLANVTLNLVEVEDA